MTPAGLLLVRTRYAVLVVEPPCEGGYVLEYIATEPA